jgi:cysteine desulfurase
VLYLDNNATTPPAPEVVDAIVEALRSGWGNPSSLHRVGQAARRRVELARESVARLLGASEREIVFTSGGTEGANLAIRGGVAVMGSEGALVTSRTEHEAVRHLAESLEAGGRRVLWLPVDGRGVVDLDALRQIVREHPVALVSIMWANNETGVIQPVADAAALCHERGILFHSDATQYVGRMPVDLASCPIDLLSCSAHKFHGPKGVGALFVRRGVRLAPEMVGGPQERRRRGGTENVPGIVGLGVAADLARAWLAGAGRDLQASLRDRFEERVGRALPGCAVHGAAAPRLWNTSSLALPGVEAEPVLLALSERGVCISAGAACASGSLDPSPVLRAMGIGEDPARGSVRVSLSRHTTAGEVEEGAAHLIASVERLRAAHGALEPVQRPA